jgi:hypothetical protein
MIEPTHRDERALIYSITEPFCRVKRTFSFGHDGTDAQHQACFQLGYNGAIVPCQAVFSFGHDGTDAPHQACFHLGHNGVVVPRQAGFSFGHDGTDAPHQVCFHLGHKRAVVPHQACFHLGHNGIVVLRQASFPSATTISDRRDAGALDVVRDYAVTYLTEAPLRRLCPPGRTGGA